LLAVSRNALPAHPLEGGGFADWALSAASWTMPFEQAVISHAVAKKVLLCKPVATDIHNTPAVFS